MQTLRCDILILGAGPAGLSAALARSKVTDKQVIIPVMNPLLAVKSGAMVHKVSFLHWPAITD